ncbi:MAG: APC family permease [Deltaproteobacteria bacterium]|nr:APC family permease [Deltaproteobacteria bacterium]
MPFIILNIVLVSLAVYFFTRKNLLSYFKSGHLWLSWLAIGVITLMDELTSLFYAPGEAYRYLGVATIIFLPLTSLVVRFLSTRMTSIAEILDRHNMKGGGVYSFSYLVLGPLISFVAVASILITYVLTASISSVSAVENVSFFLNLGNVTKLAIEVIIVWIVAGLNILGIKENARVTFTIFLFTAVILLNLLLSGVINFEPENLAVINQSFSSVKAGLTQNGLSGGGAYLIASVSNCILAYSGIESVLQVARLSESWHNIKRAYTFLALTVGIFTPLISVIVLSNPNIDFAAHETDLFTHFSVLMNGQWFGILISAVASLCLVMAVNTSCVASSELIERVANRYGFEWLIATNKRDSLYRIHIVTATFFSLIIIITQGQQMALAAMYAVGLVASFVINMLCLVIYNYQKGIKEAGAEYHINRVGTFILLIFISCCFLYLVIHKPFGSLMWFVCTIICLIIGYYGTRKRRPELKQIAKGETPMDIVLYIAEQEGDNIHIHFKRYRDTPLQKLYDIAIFITFFSPRQKIPPRQKEHHFRIPFKRANIFANIQAILHLLVYELPHKNITVHFGWPLSSWFERLSTGIMVMNFMKMPKLFPTVNFKIEQFKL